VNNCKLPELIKLKTFSDERGSLSFGEKEADWDFDIKRIYYLYSIPEGMERGGHAHKALEQVLIPISGSFTVVTDDGAGNIQEWEMNKPNQALRLHSPIWREIKDFSNDGVCLVLASDLYKEDDYIKDYDEFLGYLEVDK